MQESHSSEKKTTVSSEEAISEHASRQSPKKGGSHAVQRKLRLDRIAIVVVPLLLIILLIAALCLHSCNRRETLNGGISDSEGTPVASATTTTVSTEAGADTEVQSDTTDDVAQMTATSSEESSTSANQDAQEVTIRASRVASGDLIVINQDNRYSFPSDDISLVSVYENHSSSYSVSDMEVQLDSETVQQLNAMMDAFVEETGIGGMQVFSGYRTESDQQSRYESGSSSFAGGYSDYHSGRTFNLKIDFGDGTSDYYNPEKYPNYIWFADHAADYGFVVRYPDGKEDITGESSRYYTFRYVGMPHAAYMTQQNLCLEEYVAQLQNDTSPDDPLTYTDGDTRYAIFYVPVGDGDAQVHFSVPSNAYTISGDNMGGLIVTCELAE